MECGVLGAPAIGDQILERYQHDLNDHPPEALRRFYESYRAMVRAKVNALRTLQLSGTARTNARQVTQRYLDWADERLGRWLPAAVIVVSGLSGTGKSVIAQAVAERYQGILLSTDELRRESAPTTPTPMPRTSSTTTTTTTTTTTMQYGAQRYSAQSRDAVYELLLERADEHRVIILDGTFLRSQWLAAARQLAANRQAEFLLIRCECPLDVARDRVAQRAARGDSASEITVEHLERQRAELPLDWNQWPHLRLDTTQSLPDLLAAIDARCRVWSQSDSR
jgi:predicted kinase